MDRWDVIVVLAAGYVAVMTLVRLMARRRNQALQQFHEQVAEQLGNNEKSKSDDELAEGDRGAA